MGSVFTHTIVIETHRQGLYEITDDVTSLVHQYAALDGLLTLFIMHTSASLIVQENADPSARHDLEQWLNRLVPEHDPNFTHITEGPDDMPAHIKAALTSTNISIPIAQGRLCLGTWQGIYVWEHRRARHKRKVALSLISA